MANITKPTLYYIKHSLADSTLTEQAFASFTDEDLAEYRSEYDEYLTTQHQAVKNMAVLGNECMSYIKAIFGGAYDSKQVRYFERNMRNGENFVDIHARKYTSPDTVDENVREARKKYCSFMGNDNAPKVGGEDTLQEINNAVSFLLKRGLTLNIDFTVSNSVMMAKTIASQDFDDSVVSKADEGASLTQHNVMMKDGTPFPSKSFAVKAKGGNRFSLTNLEINKEVAEYSNEIQEMLNNGATYSISFLASDEPQFTVC